HAARTGRFMPWGFIILFLPAIGALAYVVVELAPEWLGSRRARQARGRLAGALDPGRRYRELRDQLAVVDTVANRSSLAEECLALGRFDEALAQYNAVLAMPLGDEPSFMLGKARAQLGLGDAAGAVTTFDELKRLWPKYETPEAELVRAIALEGAGRMDEALAGYGAASQHFPGVEPNVRLAQLLKRLGRDAEAQAVAQDVVTSLRRAPPHVRANERQWLASAERIAGS
ncbi:MAG: tetratricopeptide repeat protein, partial [Bradyrhizobium sp.]